MITFRPIRFLYTWSLILTAGYMYGFFPAVLVFLATIDATLRE
jgi:hypothetical protein